MVYKSDYDRIKHEYQGNYQPNKRDYDLVKYLLLAILIIGLKLLFWFGVWQLYLWVAPQFGLPNVSAWAFFALGFIIAILTGGRGRR